MDLDLSLGEFEALAAKALRGTGYSWGAATDGAHAALVLAQNGLPAAEIALRLVTHVEYHGPGTSVLQDPSSGRATAPICAVTYGAALSDLAGAAPDLVASVAKSRPVIEPLLLAPFLTNCVIGWADGSVCVTHRGIELNGSIPVGAVHITIDFDGYAGTDLEDGCAVRSHKGSTRAVVTPATYWSLQAFAARTYAPASKQSRSSGAGAD